MATQVVLNGDHAMKRPGENKNAALRLGDFHFTSVDEKFRHRQQEDGQVVPAALQATAAAPFFPPEGVLDAFEGNFAGTGFNTIWRPRNSASQDPPVAGLPANQAPQPPNDAILQLNLTTEQLSFSGALGDVPNRGAGTQPDISLACIPYVQKIQNVANEATGKADLVPPQDIHFEPGMFLRIPATAVSPPSGPILCRMASIPHGTTINAQCLEPQTSAAIATAPTIKVADITPFQLNNPSQPIKNFFPQQGFTNQGTSRIPQNLKAFGDAKTITPDMLKDPNQTLRDALVGLNVIKTVEFTVATKAAPLIGGGTANIAFLEGSGFKDLADGKNSAPLANASAIAMSSTFWIETVEWRFTIPAGKPFPLDVKPNVVTKAPLPTFTISGPTAPLTQPKTLVRKTTQIQYSQNVTLNFSGLSWPHISVATLGPADKIPIILQT